MIKSEDEKQEIIERLKNTINILSYSYGKDSGACIGACKELGIPIAAIVTADVWATSTIPADLPAMVEWKTHADEIIKELTGLTVIHLSAKKVDKVESDDKVTYDQYFNQVMDSGKHTGTIKGFPMHIGNWCTKLKLAAVDEINRMSYEDYFYHELQSGKRAGTINGFPFPNAPSCNGALKRPVFEQMDKMFEKKNTVSLIGIALDEPERLERIDNIKKVSPLELIGWTEQDAMDWCIKNDLRSPTYDDSSRGGCWFCHNQSVDQLRKLYHTYPDLWEILLKWDSDSPVSFHADGRTVHDFDRRFKAEDERRVPMDRRFRWSMLDNKSNQETLFSLFGYE